MLARHQLSDDDAFGKFNADQRAELRIAAFDQLAKPRRIQPRRGGAGVGRRKLRSMTRQRGPFRARISFMLDCNIRRLNAV